MKLGFLPALIGLLLMGCGGGTTTGNPVDGTTEDTSVTGSVVSVVGGALSGTSSTGTQARAPQTHWTWYASASKALNFIPEALASVSCPTYRSTGSDCAVSGGTMWLSYGDCNFDGSAANWSGVQALIMGARTAQCGTFPDPGAASTLTRQFVSAAGSATPGSATDTSGIGTVVTIDNASANLSNFDQQAISTIANGGYGTQVSFGARGVRTSLTLAERVSTAGKSDLSIAGSLTISESSGATSRTVSGSITTYHNLLQVIGTSTFTDVVHSDSCCFPISGVITTSFAASANSGLQPRGNGVQATGHSETLTIKSCGVGTLQGYDGTTSEVTLTHCF